MRNWRLIILGILIAGPVLFLMGYGSYHLWLSGLSFWVWWPMMASLALAYFLGWRWQRKQKLLNVDFTPDLHWTDRDKAAWKLVEDRAKAAERIPSDRLVEMTFYLDVAQEMALEFARFYHPRAKDPFSSLTLQEILAVVELSSHDLSELVDKYLPGGHLMTINDWKNARKATDYYQTASNVYWAISALFSPVNTAMRYLASRAGVSRPLALLQQNLLLWFYTAFLQRMGTYLIELNSGRLRIGVERYRELIERRGEGSRVESRGQGSGVRGQESGVNARTQSGFSSPLTPDPSPLSPNATPLSVTIGLIGQVKAGKSSLINALLGDQRAKTNVLPETSEVTRYQLLMDNTDQRLEILDTVGYGHEGPREDQMPATQNAAKQSDVLLLVLHARTAARQPDLQMLQALRKWFDSRPELKMPTVVAVLTHIDLLSPAVEWQPPYDWQRPTRVKEQQIAEAVEAARQQLGNYVSAVVPVCVAEGRAYGVQEWLMPVLMNLLGEARGVALLRCLHAEVNAEKIRKVFYQLLAAGKEIAMVLLEAQKRR